MTALICDGQAEQLLLDTPSGFMYMAAIIDWHSKAILSYKLSNLMDSSLVTRILEDALSKYS